MFRLRSDIWILLVLALVPAGHAGSCTCAPLQSVPEAFEFSSAVFIGTVTAMELLPRPEWPESPTDEQKMQIADLECYRQQITIQVRRGFKGVNSEKFMVYTGCCEFFFALGHEYLVYAYDRGGRPVTDMCTRTSQSDACDVEVEVVDLIALSSGIYDAPVRRY